MHLAFQALLDELTRAIGAGAARALLDGRGVPQAGRPAYVTLGVGPTRVKRSLEAATTACVVMQTVFEAVVDDASPAWFVWTQERYQGSLSPYRPEPAERPTIWDEPDLLHPDIRALAVEREWSIRDRLSEDETVYRQWVVLSSPRVLGMDALLRALAWSNYASSDIPGPRLWADLWCVPSGGGVVFQGRVKNGACRLLAGDAALLHPLLHPYRAWVQETSPELTVRVTDASREPPEPEARAVQPADPMPDLTWKVWYEDLFDRETPRTVMEQGQGLVEGLTALWGRHLVDVPGGLSRYNLYGRLGSLEITGDVQAQQTLRIWIYGPRRVLKRGYRQEADLPLLRKVARAHALRVTDRQRTTHLLALVAASTDRFDFERRLDQLLAQDAPADAAHE